MKAIYQTVLKSRHCDKFWNQALVKIKVSNQKYNYFISFEKQVCNCSKRRFLSFELIL